MKQGWDYFLQEMIKLALFLAAAYGVWWKGVDGYEKIVKEKSIGKQALEEIKKLVEENNKTVEKAIEGNSKQVEKNQATINELSNRIAKNSEEIVGIKAKAAEMLTIVLSYFKK